MKPHCLLDQCQVDVSVGFLNFMVWFDHAYGEDIDILGVFPISEYRRMLRSRVGQQVILMWSQQCWSPWPNQEVTPRNILARGVYTLSARMYNVDLGLQDGRGSLH